jgi:hypothetical protein
MKLACLKELIRFIEITLYKFLGFLKGFQEKLKKYPQRKPALYQGGTLHRGLVEGVYSSNKLDKK